MIMDRTELTDGHASPLCKRQGGAIVSASSTQPNAPLNPTACKLRAPAAG